MGAWCGRGGSVMPVLCEECASYECAWKLEVCILTRFGKAFSLSPFYLMDTIIMAMNIIKVALQINEGSD